jgi:hypothetical protein
MSTVSFQIHPSFRERQPRPGGPRIDRPNSRMYGIVAGMDVEATGHGICCDVKSLELIAQLANQGERPLWASRHERECDGPQGASGL